MKITEARAELIKEPNILKKIELAGRVCYNSQNKITEDSYKKFIANIVKSGHTSVLEHSNIIVKYYTSTDYDDIAFVFEWLSARKGITNSHVWITVEGDTQKFIVISGNVRAWQDFLNKDITSSYLVDGDDHISNLYNALQKKYPELFIDDITVPWTNFDIEFLTEEEAAKINILHTSYTFAIETSRDITHQIVRHRTLSFSQQSQRYVNYTLDKNDGEITFIKPRIEENTQSYNAFIDICTDIENIYSEFINDGYKPEISRCILPNCTKAIIYVTGHYKDWMHFIELRSDEHSQEEIQYIANKIDKEIKKCYL